MTLANVFVKTTRDRWKSMAIGSLTLSLLLLFGMAVYKDIDLSLYTSLPDVFLEMFGIPPEADVGSLAYSAIYGSYGAFTMAALVLAMGAASIAGEEQKGTIGLLLANPKSRVHVLAAKAASMVVLSGLGVGLLWVTGIVAPEVLGVSTTGLHVGALMFHMFVMTLFFGFMAVAIGAWTGSSGAASGAAAGLMMVSFIGTGVFPLIDGWENVVKVLPWYYFTGSDPVANGISWGHMGVLSGAIVVFAAVAVVGLTRRDLKSQAVAVTVLDRLRSNPLTHKIADRLAGSARVSHIWIKTASEHQAVGVTTAMVMFWMGIMIGPMYTLIDEALISFAEGFPEVLLALFGGGDMATPEGFYQIEIFGLMAPMAVMIVTIAIGSKALAGEEERRTMGLLLSNPIKRSTVLSQKMITMVLYAVGVAFAIFASTVLGSMLGNLGIGIGRIAAASGLCMLAGLVFGVASLALGAATGRVKVASYGTVGIALVFWVLNAFLPYSESLSGWAKVSPFYYYLSNDPLMNGMHWGHAAVLVGLAAILFALAVFLFERRDLRQSG